MTERCSSCRRVLRWSGDRLVCANPHCTTGHRDLTGATADPPPPSVIGVHRPRRFQSANPPTSPSAGGHRAPGGGAETSTTARVTRHLAVSLPDVYRANGERVRGA
jgi:hypothetical protein